jgi:hypothetical protein
MHRQVLQISALHIFLREVLFAYGAVEKPIGGGNIPSRLIKVLLPGKDEYAIIAAVLRDERAKNSRDSSMDDEDLHSRTSKKRTAHRERGQLPETTRNYSCTTHQRKRKAAPQAMQSAIKKSRWKAWLSGQSEAKTSAFCLLIASQSRLQ